MRLAHYLVGHDVLWVMLSKGRRRRKKAGGSAKREPSSCSSTLRHHNLQSTVGPDESSLTDVLALSRNQRRRHRHLNNVSPDFRVRLERMRLPGRRVTAIPSSFSHCLHLPSRLITGMASHSSKRRMKVNSVCIIGAGPSGLAAAK